MKEGQLGGSSEPDWRGAGGEKEDGCTKGGISTYTHNRLLWGKRLHPQPRRLALCLWLGDGGDLGLLLGLLGRGLRLWLRWRLLRLWWLLLLLLLLREEKQKESPKQGWEPQGAASPSRHMWSCRSLCPAEGLEGSETSKRWAKMSPTTIPAEKLRRKSRWGRVKRILG